MVTELRYSGQVVEVTSQKYAVGITTGILGGAPYDGQYTVTPADTAQTLRTQGKTMAYDVVVNPIPQNYGLITWDGSTLLVS